MSSIRARTLSGFRWSATVKLACQVITWAITLLVVRLLTPADYGLLAMATVFVAFLTMFSEVGLGVAVVQTRRVDRELLRRVFGVVLVVHLALAALLALSAPLIAAFYNEPRVEPVVRVLSIQFILAAFAVIPDAQLQRRLEFRNRSLLDLTIAIAGSCTTLALAASGAGVWALVAGSVLGQLLKTIGLNVISPFLHWPEFSVRGMRSLLAFGGHVTAAGIFSMFFAQIDSVICAKILGNEILGAYSVGVNIASLPNQKTAAIINAVAFPAFSSIQGDVRKVRENLLLGIRVLSFFVFPIAWGMSSVAPEIVEIVLGPKWMLAILPLQALTVIIPLRMIVNFLSVVVQARGRPDIILRNAVWAAVLGPPILFAGAYIWGLAGLSFSWLLLSPLLVSFIVIRSGPVLELHPLQILAAMRTPAIAAAAMYAAVVAARQFVHGGDTRLVQLVVLVVVGAAVYSVVSLLISRKRALEVLAFLQGIAVSRVA